MRTQAPKDVGEHRRLATFVATKALIAGMVLFLNALLGAYATASGISLGASRVIHPAGTRQSTFSVNNRTATSNYLVQSWVETANGARTTDFVVTPPLYKSAPNSENLLRIISTGAAHAPGREALYYLNIKLIPAVDKEAREKGNAGLAVGTVVKIKLFVRPIGLEPLREQAAQRLAFTRNGECLDIRNPTPYFLTLTHLKAGRHTFEDVMVAPMESAIADLPPGSGDTISWRSIGDHGEIEEGRGRIH